MFRLTIDILSIDYRQLKAIDQHKSTFDCKHHNLSMCIDTKIIRNKNIHENVKDIEYKHVSLLVFKT